MKKSNAQKLVQQVLRCHGFLQCHHVIMLARCCRNLALVYINWPVVKLVLLNVFSLEVTGPIDSVKLGLLYIVNHYLCKNKQVDSSRERLVKEHNVPGKIY